MRESTSFREQTLVGTHSLPFSSSSYTSERETNKPGMLSQPFPRKNVSFAIILQDCTVPCKKVVRRSKFKVQAKFFFENNLTHGALSSLVKLVVVFSDFRVQAEKKKIRK